MFFGSMTPRLGGSHTLVSVHFFMLLFYVHFAFSSLEGKLSGRGNAIIHFLHISSQPLRVFCSPKVPDKKGDLSIFMNPSTDQGSGRIPLE